MYLSGIVLFISALISCAPLLTSSKQALWGAKKQFQCSFASPQIS